MALTEHRILQEMSVEEKRLMNRINQKLTKAGLKSRLSYLCVSGISEGFVTDWQFEEIISTEQAAASIIVSEAIRELK
jgi:hypothetical protein